MTDRPDIEPVENSELYEKLDATYAAVNWGEKWGFTVVYFLPTRERVYANQMNAVCIKAKKLETDSVRLLANAQAAIERTR